MDNYYIQEAPEPLKKQVGGDHYKKMKIQPAEYIYANNIGFLEGEAIAYVSRWKDKNGIQDVEKAIHVLQILVQLEKAKNETGLLTSNSPQIVAKNYYDTLDKRAAQISQWIASGAAFASSPITGCCKKDK